MKIQVFEWLLYSASPLVNCFALPKTGVILFEKLHSLAKGTKMYLARVIVFNCNSIIMVTTVISFRFTLLLIGQGSFSF